MTIFTDEIPEDLADEVRALKAGMSGVAVIRGLWTIADLRAVLKLCQEKIRGYSHMALPVSPPAKLLKLRRVLGEMLEGAQGGGEA